MKKKQRKSEGKPNDILRRGWPNETKANQVLIFIQECVWQTNW